MGDGEEGDDVGEGTSREGAFTEKEGWSWQGRGAKRVWANFGEMEYIL